MNQQLLCQTYPGGVYLGFNAVIDRKSAEQLVYMVNDTIRNGYPEVNILISSFGGDLAQAYYACTSLEALPTKIITYNTGNIGSAANLLFMIGAERYAIDGSSFYFHQTSFPPPTDQTTAAFANSRAQWISREDRRSCDFVAKRTGVPTKTVAGWQKRELFLDTDAALSNGLIHAIKAPTIPPNAFFCQIII